MLKDSIFPFSCIKKAFADLSIRTQKLKKQSVFYWQLLKIFFFEGEQNVVENSLKCERFKMLLFNIAGSDFQRRLEAYMEIHT